MLYSLFSINLAFYDIFYVNMPTNEFGYYIDYVFIIYLGDNEKSAKSIAY